MYYTYVLKSNKSGRLYFGYTGDLEKRLKEHNTGKNIYTRYRGSWNLIYFEVFATKSLAIKREIFFKSGKGREYIKSKMNSTM